MTNTIDIGLFWISFWFFLGSFLFFTVYSAVKKRNVGIIATSAFFIGFVFLTAGVVARWWISTHPPLSSMYEYAITMSWFIALAFILFLAKYRKMILGVVISPLLIMVMVMASLLPKDITRQLMPALQSYWFYIHVSLAVVSEGAFIVAAGAGILYLFREKKANSQSFLPSLDFLEEIISRSIRIGYPLFTIGALFAGAVWAQTTWGAFWGWDPKETGSLVIWLFYTLLLHQNIRGFWRGRTLAIMSLVGVAIIVISFLGNLFLGGLHSYI